MTYPDEQSYLATGKMLDDVLKDHSEYLVTHAASVANGELPILIKLIDAKKDFSIQVHLDDEYAWSNENKSLGKTEKWYVLNAKEDSELVYGFN